MKPRVWLLCAMALLISAVAMAAGGAFNVSKISLGVPSRGVGVDDFNNDGYLDIVSHGSDGNIYLLTNDGTNHFVSTNIGSVTSSEAGDIGTGDFNGDGYRDFAFTDETSVIYIFTNNNDGSFAGTSFNADRGMLIGIDCADMNGDFNTDLAVAGYNPPEVLILLGNGDGSFAYGPRFNPGNYTPAGMTDNLGITVGDFNKDGYMDIITGQDDDAEPGAAWLFAGAGDGTFTYIDEAYDTNPINESGGNLPGAGHPDAFDFDADGNLEILTSKPTSGAGNPPGIGLFFNGDGSGIYTSCDTIVQCNSLLMACSTPPLGFPPRNSFSVLGSWTSDTAFIVAYELISYWPMDELSGDIVGDSSGNDFDATAINAPIATGIIGNCRIFNGIDAQIDCGSRPEFNLVTPFSFTKWVKVNNPLDWPFILSNAGDYRGFWFRISHDGDLASPRFDFNLQGSGLSDGPQSQTIVHSGTWYHIACVAESDTELKLYVNGRLDGQKTINPGYISTAIRNLKMGIDANFYSQSPPLLNGAIDEVRLFAKALTIEEIRALFGPGILSIPKIYTCLNTLPEVVPIRLICQSRMAGLTIPLTWDYPGLSLDSVSFVNTALTSWAMAYTIDNINRTVLIGGADINGDVILPDTDTVLAYLYFSLNIACDPAMAHDFITCNLNITTIGEEELLFGDDSQPPLGFVPAIDFGDIVIQTYLPGDATTDCTVNILDIISIINWKFKGQAHPACRDNAIDVNGDCAVNIIDIIYLIDYKFKGGPAPVCGRVENPAMGSCCGKVGIVSTEKIASATLKANYANGKTLISTASPMDIRGIELILKNADGTEISIINKINGLQPYYSQKEEIITLGLLDINGEGFIPAGQLVILEIEGQVEIIEALGADNEVQSVYFDIVNNASKTENLPTEYALLQNTPNPFNPVTEIAFSLPVAGDVKLEVYNILGQKVATLAEGFLEAGNHVARWDASTMASGIYLYRLEAGEFNASRKMLLLK